LTHLNSRSICCSIRRYVSILCYRKHNCSGWSLNFNLDAFKEYCLLISFVIRRSAWSCPIDVERMPMLRLLVMPSIQARPPLECYAGCFARVPLSGQNPHNSSRIVADDAKRDLPRRTHGCAAASMGAVLPKAVQARRPHKNRTDSVESLCSGFVSTLVQYLRTFVSPACARRCSSWLSRQKSNARPASRPILGSPKLGFTPKGLSQGSGD